MMTAAMRTTTAGMTMGATMTEATTAIKPKLA